MFQWLADIIQNRASRRRLQKLQKEEQKLLKDIRKLEKKNESEKTSQTSQLRILKDQKDKLIEHNTEIQMTMIEEKQKMCIWIGDDSEKFKKDKNRSHEEKSTRAEMQETFFSRYSFAFDISTNTMLQLVEDLRIGCSSEESEALRKKIITCWRLQTSAYHAVLIYSKELRAKELKEKIEEHEDKMFRRDWDEFGVEFPEVVNPPEDIDY